MTTMMDLQINDENSLKSFYSALSTLDEDTLVDTLIIADKTPLTRVNLVKHLINTIELKDVRMMQYIDLQQHLIQKQQQQQQVITNHDENIWGKRKSIKNRVGYHGNHLGYYYIINKQTQQKNNLLLKKFKRMLGRTTVLFRYNKKDTNNILYDDSDNLIAIGYDDVL